MEDKSCMFPFVCPYYLYITSFVYQDKYLANVCYVMQSYGPLISNIRKKVGRGNDTEITWQLSFQELATTYLYCNKMLNVCQNLKYLTQRGFVEMQILILILLCIAGMLG